jgi:hypothetical protein
VLGNAAVLVCPRFSFSSHLNRRSAGGIIGSSVKLLDELIELAPYLGVALEDDDSLSLDEAARIYQLADTKGTPLEQEFKAWLALHEVAELSLTHQTAVYLS